MRILIVSTYFPPHVGGVEVVAEQQARVLALAGHDVVVATSRWNRDEPEAEPRDGYRIRWLPANDIIERMGVYARQLAETHFDAAAGHSAMVRLYDEALPGP